MEKTPSTQTISKAGFLLQAATKLPTADEIDNIRLAAKDEGYNEGRKIGFESGLKEGLKEGKKRIDQEVARLGSYITHLMVPLEDQKSSIVEAMQKIAISATEKILKRQLESNPEWIVAILEECLERLPIGYQKVQIKIPDLDFEKISLAIQQLPQYNAQWTIISDTRIHPPKLVIEALPSKITIDVNELINTYFENVFKKSNSIGANGE